VPNSAINHQAASGLRKMDIEVQASAADKALQDLQQAVQAASKGKRDEQVKQIALCETKAQRLKHSLDSYRLELRDLPSDEQAIHRERLKALEDNFKQCRTQIEWKRLDVESSAPSSSSDMTSSGAEPDGPVSVEQAVAMASEVQNQSELSVARTKKMALEAEDMGTNILQTMNEQTEQLRHIKDDVEDIKADLVRSKKLVGMIARSAASDRCIQMLCVLVTISIMIMIVLAMTGRDGGELNVPDPVRQSEG